MQSDSCTEGVLIKFILRLQFPIYIHDNDTTNSKQLERAITDCFIRGIADCYIRVIRAIMPRFDHSMCQPSSAAPVRAATELQFIP